MKILFTICGRAGSKGIKNKNLKDFCGKKLAWYSLSAIDLYVKNYMDGDVQYDIVANSDSMELLDILSNNPMVPVEQIVRDARLGGDNVGKKDVILDCLVQMEERKSCKYDVVVDLDITSPLRTAQDVHNLLKTHFEKKAIITYSVTSARRNPYFNQVTYDEVNGAGKVIKSDFTARQQAPTIYDMNASLYAYDPDYLKTGGNFTDGYNAIIEMYDTAVLDLDHENDFELMEIIADYLYNNKPEFAQVRDNIPE